jgi:hypothetical protein
LFNTFLVIHSFVHLPLLFSFLYHQIFAMSQRGGSAYMYPEGSHHPANHQQMSGPISSISQSTVDNHARDLQSILGYGGPPPVTGEHAQLVPHDFPNNRWNHGQYPWRGRFFTMMFALSYLAYAAFAGMMITELLQTDFTHKWDMNYWWAFTLSTAIISFVGFVATCFLNAKKRPIDQKNMQDYPPPPQDWRIAGLGLLMYACAFGLMAYVDALSAVDRTAIRYNNDLRVVMTTGLLGALVFLHPFVLALQMPVSMASLHILPSVQSTT